VSAPPRSTATGWKAPERFAAKGRDGITDIYGVIWRPKNFDERGKYPVIENIYAGPQGSFAPKAFRAASQQQKLADLERGIKLDPKQPQALMAVAQMNVLPKGDMKRAKEAAGQAVDAAGDDAALKAQTLLLRSKLEENLDKRLADMNEAVRLAGDDAGIVLDRLDPHLAGWNGDLGGERRRGFVASFDPEDSAAMMELRTGTKI